MEPHQTPLSTYATELLHSYSRLIVYSGDILRSLPEPREGLSVANIKPKKDESTAFLREWQHLESVFDEYLIRLNDIRTRAREELEAARVKCLVGEDIDLTLPEAVAKLGCRLARFKKQYESLQRIMNGEPMSEEDAGEEVADGAAEGGEDQDVEMKDAEEAAEVVVDASNFADGNSNSLETAAESTSLIIPAETNADTANPADDGGETTTENAADPVPLPSSSEAPPTVETTAETAMAAAPPAEIEEAAVGDSVPSVAGASSDTPVQSVTTDYDVISVDDGTNNDPIEVDTSSDVDNDEDMEKMFQ